MSLRDTAKILKTGKSVMQRVKERNNLVSRKKEKVSKKSKDQKNTQIVHKCKEKNRKMVVKNVEEHKVLELKEHLQKRDIHIKSKKCVVIKRLREELNSSFVDIDSEVTAENNDEIKSKDLSGLIPQYFIV
ncbi:hypothetical protein ILUMI_16980 [Ignelater luminosus]|uniref:SAP domain-containing protein n=1 Tax=Ignelater luminosus TaxID=2038154 RepID=A0A8K0CKQ8_IGNLU|nr:hypothetical protein ILUMI_16980 [Ignelater luminosus]